MQKVNEFFLKKELPLLFFSSWNEKHRKNNLDQIFVTNIHVAPSSSKWTNEFWFWDWFDRFGLSHVTFDCINDIIFYMEILNKQSPYNEQQLSQFPFETSCINSTCLHAN